MNVSPTVLARVAALVSEAISLTFTRAVEVDAEATLDDLRVDPIDRIQISCAIEEEWNIELTDAEIERWATIRDIAASVELHCGEVS